VTRLTDDPADPDLTHGADPEGARVPQAGAYLVLPEQERAKGFIRPVRRSYWHAAGCGQITTMSQGLAETYARQPSFYGATYCTTCQRHAPVSEFRWQIVGDDTDPPVGS
jgi:hypothetical protein